MMRFCTLSALAVLGCAHGRIRPDTVTHVRSTLRTLLESVQREVQEADDGLQKTERWCAATLSDLSAVHDTDAGHMSEMQMDLHEEEAAAFEFQGLVTQIGADMDLIHRTISETEEMRRVWVAESRDQKRSVWWSQQTPKSKLQRREATERDLHAIADLLDTKQTTLSSLKAEHELVQLAHEEAQWQAVEMKHRLANRRNTITAERGFFEMLAYGCRGHEMRVAASAAARTREAFAAEHVLAALGRADEQPAAELPGSQPQVVVAENPTNKDFELSFLQRAKGNDTTPEQHVAASLQGDSSRPNLVPAFTSTRIRFDFAQINSEALGAGERRRRCAQEQEHNYLVLRLAGDLVRQIGAEMDAHSAAEMLLQDGLKELQLAGDVLNSIVQHVETAAQQENVSLTRMEEDRKFTSAILDQAVAVFDGLEQSGNSTQESTPSDIVALLTAANASCYQSVDASKGARNEAGAVAKDIVTKANELASARRAEASEMEHLRDEHISQCAALSKTKKAYESEVAQALDYLDKLKQECSPPAQMHHIDDALRVPQAEPRVPTANVRGSLRGLYASEAETEVEQLPPFEHAATDTNVSSDGS